MNVPFKPIRKVPPVQGPACGYFHENSGRDRFWMLNSVRKGVRPHISAHHRLFCFLCLACAQRTFRATILQIRWSTLALWASEVLWWWNSRSSSCTKVGSPFEEICINQSWNLWNMTEQIYWGWISSGSAAKIDPGQASGHCFTVVLLPGCHVNAATFVLH